MLPAPQLSQRLTPVPTCLGAVARSRAPCAERSGGKARPRSSARTAGWRHPAPACAHRGSACAGDRPGGRGPGWKGASGRTRLGTALPPRCPALSRCRPASACGLSPRRACPEGPRSPRVPAAVRLGGGGRPRQPRCAASVCDGPEGGSGATSSVPELGAVRFQLPGRTRLRVLLAGRDVSKASFSGRRTRPMYHVLGAQDGSGTRPGLPASLPGRWSGNEVGGSARPLLCRLWSERQRPPRARATPETTPESVNVAPRPREAEA